MAAIYWRGDDREGAWWIKFYPKKGADSVRVSLETVDHCRAELMQCRVELEVELRRPELSGIELPQSILNALTFSSPETTIAIPNLQPALPGMPLTSIESPAIEEVLSEFLAFIAVENSAHHAANKTSYLKKFFGCELMGIPGNEKGVFNGRTLADVKVADVRKMIDALPVSRKTKKHYREAFHALFEFAMKYSFFIPINFRYPNPMSALPTYHEKNRHIVFLTTTEVDHLLELLKPYPSVRVAVARRTAAGRGSLASEKGYFTGPAVFLRHQQSGHRKRYREPLETEWLVPSPTGLQWIGENFGDKHRTILRESDHRHTCLHYRHTFATDRAKEGWSLFRIAKTMGNSIAVCEEYYAAFIDPSLA